MIQCRQKRGEGGFPFTFTYVHVAKVPREIFLVYCSTKVCEHFRDKKLLRSIPTKLCGACEKPWKSDLNLTVSWGTNKAWKKYDFSSEGPF